VTDDFYCDEVLSGKTEVRVVRETDNVLAYHHTRPFWPAHVVVIPKRHISSLLTLEESDTALLLELIGVVRDVAQQIVSNVEPAAFSQTWASIKTRSIYIGTSAQAIR
jgi:histidine triad (HIT) family protein